MQALLRGASRSSLFSLDISRCIGVTTNGLQLPPISKLAILTATQLPNISRLVLQLSREGNLQQLNLAACPKVSLVVFPDCFKSLDRLLVFVDIFSLSSQDCPFEEKLILTLQHSRAISIACKGCLPLYPLSGPPNTERLTYCNCFSSLKTCIWWGHICKA